MIDSSIVTLSHQLQYTSESRRSWFAILAPRRKVSLRILSLHEIKQKRLTVESSPFTEVSTKFPKETGTSTVGNIGWLFQKNYQLLQNQPLMAAGIIGSSKGSLRKPLC